MDPSATPRTTKSKGSSDLPFVLASLGVLVFVAAVAAFAAVADADTDVAAVVEAEAITAVEAS